MTYTAEQFVADQKANVEVLADLAGQAMAGFEKLVDLNVATAKAAVAESFSNTQALIGAKDAQQVLALQTALFQPALEKSAAYNRRVYDIASDTSAVFVKAFETKLAEVQDNFTKSIDGALKNMPAGSDTAVSLIKGAINAGQSAVESVQAAAKQAMALAESNYNAATSQPAKTTAVARKR